MTIVFEGFLGLCPRGQSTLDFTQTRVFRELDELVNLSGKTALPADVGNEHLVAVLNDCAVGGGYRKLKFFDGSEAHVRTSSSLLHPQGINLCEFAGADVRVGGIDLRGADHLESDLLKGNQGADQAGEVAADRELGDAVFVEGLCDGLDVLVPNDLVEVNQFVSAAAAVAVCPECRGVDDLGADVLDLVGNGVLISGAFLQGVLLRFFCC